MCYICSHLSVSLSEQETEDYDDGHDTQWFGQFNVMVSHHRSELFISDLSISYLSSVQDGLTDPILSDQLQIQCPEIRRGAVLLSAERKKLVCAVRWVECDVRTTYTYVGFYQGNGKRQSGPSILKPTSYKALSETGWQNI